VGCSSTSAASAPPAVAAAAAAAASSVQLDNHQLVAPGMMEAHLYRHHVMISTSVVEEGNTPFGKWSSKNTENTAAESSLLWRHLGAKLKF